MSDHDHDEETPLNQQAIPSTSSSNPPDFALYRTNEWSGIVVGLLCNAGSAGIFLTLLLHVPQEASVRPMGHAVICFFLAVIAFCIGIPMSVIGMFRVTRWRRLLGIVGILINLTPFFVGGYMLHAVAAIGNFTLGE